MPTNNRQEFVLLFLVLNGEIVPHRLRLSSSDSMHQHYPTGNVFRGKIALHDKSHYHVPDWNTWDQTKDILLQENDEFGPDTTDVIEDGAWPGDFYDRWGNYYPNPDTVIFNPSNQYSQDNPEPPSVRPWSQGGGRG